MSITGAIMRCNLNARIRHGRHFLRVEIWHKAASPRLVETVDAAASKEVGS